MKNLYIVLLILVMSSMLNSCISVIRALAPKQNSDTITVDGALVLRKSFTNTAFSNYQKKYSKKLPENRILLLAYDSSWNYQFDILDIAKGTLINKGKLKRSLHEYDGITYLDVRNDTIFTLTTIYTSKDISVILNKIDFRTMSLIEGRVVSTTISKEKFDYDNIKPLDESRSKYLPVQDEAFLTSKSDYDEIFQTNEVLSNDSSKYMYYRVVLLDNDHIIVEGKMLDFATGSIKAVLHDLGETQSGILDKKSFTDKLVLFNNGNWVISHKLFDDGKMHTYVFHYFNGREVKKMSQPFAAITDSIDDDAWNTSSFIDFSNQSCEFIGNLTTSKNEIFYRLKFDLDNYRVKLIGKNEIAKKVMNPLNIKLGYGRISPQSRQTPNGDLVVCFELVSEHWASGLNNSSYRDGVGVGQRYVLSMSKDFRLNWINKNNERSLWVAGDNPDDSFSILNFSGDSTLVITALDSEPMKGVYFECINLNTGQTIKKERLIDFVSSRIEPSALMHYDDIVLFQTRENKANLGVYGIKK
jgi:hypothetical protein